MAQADVQNIANNDQETLTVDQNYANIAVLQNLRLRDYNRCFTVDDSSPRSLKRYTADVKNIAGDDPNYREVLQNLRI